MDGGVQLREYPEDTPLMSARRLPCLLALVLALCAATGAHAAEATPILPFVCDGCHGPGGHSAGPLLPSLAGQEPAYFVATMKRFRTGELPSTVMGPLAKGLSDADLQSMASYYARQTPVPQNAELDAVRVKLGSTVFFKHCKQCHVDGSIWRLYHQYRAYEANCNKSCHVGYGADRDGVAVPNIGGQWVEYLRQELQAFKAGARPMSERKAEAIKALSADELAAAAAFYANLKELKR